MWYVLNYDKANNERGRSLEEVIDRKIAEGRYGNVISKPCITREMTPEERERYGV